MIPLVGSDGWDWDLDEHAGSGGLTGVVTGGRVPRMTTTTVGSFVAGTGKRRVRHYVTTVEDGIATAYCGARAAGPAVQGALPDQITCGRCKPRTL